MMLRALFLHTLWRGASFVALALFSLTIVACDGASDPLGILDGGGSNDFGNIQRESAGTITVPANSQGWITPDVPLGRSMAALTTGGNVVNEFVFSSSTNLYVDGIKVGDTVYYEFDAAGNTVASSSEILFFQGAWTSSLLGQTPSVVLPPLHSRSGNYPSGSYSFKLTNPTGSDATVQIIQVRKTDDNFSSGQMDLNFFVYGDGTPNEVVPDEDAVRQVASMIGDIYSQRGVSIGTVNVEFITDSNALAEVLDNNGMVAFLQRASENTAGRGDKGVNCFLLPRLSGDTLGLDGSIPGPGIVHGTAKSGLVAQAADLGFSISGMTEDETNKWVLAKILAHELGHYAGLFHTTESGGSYNEALDDLPRCGKENDTNGDGTVTGPECRGKGAEYLMFWTFDGALVRSGNLQIDMSPQQGEMLNTFPAVN